MTHLYVPVQIVLRHPPPVQLLDLKDAVPRPLPQGVPRVLLLRTATCLGAAARQVAVAGAGELHRHRVPVGLFGDGGPGVRAWARGVLGVVLGVGGFASETAHIWIWDLCWREADVGFGF